jgi:hypothetical protein
MAPKKKDEDPLGLAELDPEIIQEKVAESKTKNKPPSELDRAKEERLAQKESRLNGPPKLPTQAPPPDTHEEVSSLLDRIAAYRERFPGLKSRTKCGPKSSLDELDDELHFIELQLGSSKAGGNVGAMLLHASMSGLEVLTRDVYNPLGLNLQGLGNITKQNMVDFLPLVDELMIKYGAGMYMPPEYRLLLSVGAMVVTVHSANSGDPRVGEAIQKMSAAVNVKGGSDL